MPGSGLLRQVCLCEKEKLPVYHLPNVIATHINEDAALPLGDSVPWGLACNQ
jgi:hypothetical protein